jgi:acetylornithine/succinyldiaminopimelate/putrescine aminotransferase
VIRAFNRSLCNLIGEPYCRAVAEVAGMCGAPDAWERANEEVAFVTDTFLAAQDRLLDRIGEQVCERFADSVAGAPSASFRAASALNAAPLGGVGFIRIGEDGRCYLAAKSEHYHASLGHGFPGYRLLARGAEVGLLNATHNNTRGHVTRLLERRLIEIVNGLHHGSDEDLDELLGRSDAHTLNRVINLETGSLAVEAGVKMMLSRFYRLDRTSGRPEYGGKIPVFLVMGDFDGGRSANYHGTTVLTQGFRDLWPELDGKLDQSGTLQAVPVRINDLSDFSEKVERYNTGAYKIAGFLHEIVLMNYGAIVLEKDYLQNVYELCRISDIPVLVDEIQTGIWYPDHFLFLEYGLKPDFVAVGKGFPGGQYPASKIITTARMDTLNLFGALVTNGQEELASLSYLITIEFARENADHIGAIGRYYEQRLSDLMEKHPDAVAGIEGAGLLSAVRFHREADAVAFAKALNRRCIDISVHTYKPKCPPTALTKLPLVSTERMIDTLVRHFDEVLS